MKRTPCIVENQCGSSDMTQSTDVNVTVRAKATGRLPRSAASGRFLRGRRSSPAARPLVEEERDQQPPANATAARTKNGTFR
jgi:hypothetical protein